MSEISEVANPKKKNKYSIKLRQSLDNSNNSQNEDEILFSSNFLLSESNYISKTNSNVINKNRKIFDSEDSNIKKNLFSSENVQKSDNKKRSSEINSTEPTSSKVKEYKPQKKRFSMIKLIEKEKRNKKYNCQFEFKKKEKQESPEKIERRDIYGNIISKKNKKNVKVTFVDKVTTQPLVNIVDIECFKNYNYIYDMPKEDKIDKSANCQCCITF